MDFWEKVKKDLKKGINEGISAVREGVDAVREKADELTLEGKKQIGILQLKTKVHREVAELGGKVYGLASKMRNPMLDEGVKAVVARINRLETEIAKLEGKVVPAAAAGKKRGTGKPSAPKKTAAKPKAPARKAKAKSGPIA